MKQTVDQPARVPRPAHVLVRVLPKRPLAGALVEFLAMFTRDGQPYDPASPMLRLRHHLGREADSVELAREGAGEYSAHVTVGPEPGVWLWRVQSGGGEAIAEGNLVVQPSSFS